MFAITLAEVWMSEDMDVNAGRVLEGTATLEEVEQEIFDLVIGLARGQHRKSEEMGHREFILTYNSFTPIGPACLPV